jgi:hypothetical protein
MLHSLCKSRKLLNKSEINLLLSLYPQGFPQLWGKADFGRFWRFTEFHVSSFRFQKETDLPFHVRIVELRNRAKQTQEMDQVCMPPIGVAFPSLPRTMLMANTQARVGIPRATAALGMTKRKTDGRTSVLLRRRASWLFP